MHAGAARAHTRDLPNNKQGQVLIRNEFIGVNYIDTYWRTGLYTRPSLPAGLGEEGAGTIAAVGPGALCVRCEGGCVGGCACRRGAVLARWGAAARSTQHCGSTLPHGAPELRPQCCLWRQSCAPSAAPSPHETPPQA
jgi:hypothetical protein